MTNQLLAELEMANRKTLELQQELDKYKKIVEALDIIQEDYLPEDIDFILLTRKDYLQDKAYHENSEIEEYEVDGYYFKNLLAKLDKYKAKEKALREYCNDKSQYWGNDSYINGKNEENEEVKNDILNILDRKE